MRTHQQEADDMLTEYQAKRQPIPLEQWDQTVRRHLHYIEAGAEMAARHARQMTCKPAFKSISREELASCREVLTKAMVDVLQAEADYDIKPKEGS